MAGLIVVGIVVLGALFIWASAIRILREYERGVVFRLGRLVALKGPGLRFLIPIVDQMVRVDLRTVTLNVPPSSDASVTHAPSLLSDRQASFALM